MIYFCHSFWMTLYEPPTDPLTDHRGNCQEMLLDLKMYFPQL